MANPYRSTVTIDGTKFDAVSTQVVFATAKDRAGMPEMGSLRTKIRVWADFHDDTNLPNATLKKFFDLANVVTRDKIKDVKIEFWKDDGHQDALCSYKFKGWISNFETSNPATPDGDGAGTTSGSIGSDAGASAASTPGLNHLMVLDLEPVMNQQNFAEIAISN
jgi:hypothetical protein